MGEKIERTKKGNYVLYHPANGRPHVIKKKHRERVVYYMEKGFTTSPPKNVKNIPKPVDPAGAENLNKHTNPKPAEG